MPRRRAAMGEAGSAGEAGVAGSLFRCWEVGSGVRPDHLRIAMRAVGLAVADRGRVTRTEWFHDTQSGALFRAGLRLSREPEAGRWRLCTAGGEMVGTVRGGAARPGGDVGARLDELAGGRALVPYLEAHTDALALAGRGAGGVVVLVELGRLVVRDPFGPARSPSLRRLAVSTSGASSGAAATVVAVLRTSLGVGEDFDVLARGLDLLGLARPGAPVPDALAVTGADTIASAARKVLQRQAFKIRANLEGTVRDLDSEYLHDLRVATRRARAALRVFSGVIRPASCAARRVELAWVAGLLGNVRDLDVFLDRLQGQVERAETPAAVGWRLVEVLHERRESVRGPLVEALRSRRFARLLDDLEAGRGVSDRGAGVEAATEAGAPLIRNGISRVRRAAGDRPELLDDGRLHRLRIAFKRLRYTCEFLAGPYGEPATEAIRALVRVQDTLGRHQDAIVAGETLLGLERELATSDLAPFELGRAMGGLLQVQREEKTAARREFTDEIVKADKALSRLRRAVAGS